MFLTRDLRPRLRWAASLLVASICRAGIPDGYVEVKTLTITERSQEWRASVHAAQDLEAWSQRVEQGQADSDRPLYLSLDAASGHRVEPVGVPGGPTFQHLVDLRSLPLDGRPEPRTGLLLVARNEGYGLGLASTGLQCGAIWTMDPAGSGFVTALPPVTFSDQGEFKVLTGPQNPTLAVVADFLWGKNESRFGRHRFRISIYRMQKSGTFVPAGRYVTRKLYPSLDEADEIDVIRHELPAIRKMAASHP